MKKFYLLIIFVLIFNISDAKPPLPGNWQLVLNDDFNNFNSEIWSKTPPLGASILGKDKDINLAENTSTNNGELVFISKKQKIKTTNAKGKKLKSKYSTGYINSFGKFTQKYGYFETRLKIPTSKGLHCAFWLMPDRGVKPGQEDNYKLRKSTGLLEGNPKGYSGQGMEIDIMEHLTKWPANKFHYAVHYFDQGKEMINKTKIAELDVNLSDYTTFGLLWRPELLIWYTNDQEVWRLESARIPDVPMSIILNTIVGGWGGKVDKKRLPDYTYVDYIKVWKEIN